ncbi:MAG: substrate-binding domain-containing protein [Rivularia sp. (in: cyanobacteria)]
MRGAKFCLECGFPATLSVHTEIKGRKGTYKITEYLGIRNLGRLYAGIQSNNRQPVIIKEYLLPLQSFNQDEALERKETFKRIAGLNLADGREQNFRLVQTWEAIADEKGERCYLIAKDTEVSETLGKYLINQGGMKAPLVREFLLQGLQTLTFLHTQKLSFLSGQVQKGLEHGNINLDSVLIKLQSNKQFFTIFFCDLAKWENLFIPPRIPQPPKKTYKEDLESLGLLAFYLWLGRTTHSQNGRKIDPAEHELLPNTDNELKKFIYRLLGFDFPFQDADSAREELLILSAIKPEYQKQRPGKKKKKKKKRKKRFLVLVILSGLLAFLLLGGGIWLLFFSQRNPGTAKDSGSDSNFKEFADVPNINPGKFEYTSGKSSNWRFLLGKEPVSDKKLIQLLRKPKPNVDAIFKHITNDNDEIRSEINKVRNQEVGFAITGLVDKKIIPNDMKSEIIAHDGLLVFVAFRDNKSELLEALKGKISLEQLRKIYTGEIDNWREIVPNLNENIPIEPYFPKEEEAVDKFEQLIFKKNLKTKSEEINTGRNLFKDNRKKIETEDTRRLMNRIRNEISKSQNVGIISFAFVSKVIDQCTVYPLAITDDNNQTIQPVFYPDQAAEIAMTKPIQPSVDLCRISTMLHINIDKFETYPLKYSQYVVYSNDRLERGGPSFANLLETDEGQCLLKNLHLIPLRNVEDNACE